MFTQTFRAGQAPHITLAECTGELTVEPWDQREIAIEAETRPEYLELEGQALVVRHAHGDLRLRAPADTVVAIAEQNGDITAHGIQALRIEHAEGHVQIAAIGGEARLHDIYGTIQAEDVEALLIMPDTPAHHRRLRLGLRRHITATRIGTAEIAEAGDDLTIVTARRVEVGPVGGNATVRDVAGEVRLGAIGGNCTIELVGGQLHLAPVGGNADLRATGALLQVGDIGGNLALVGVPLAIEAGRLAVGGNARLEFLDQTDLTIHATIGGVIRSEGANSTFGGGLATVSYGAGAARLELIVGGNLDLHGGAPQISSAFWRELARPGPAQHPRSPKPAGERKYRGAAPERGAAHERLAILHMVAAGQISTEEAERRLDALDRR